MGPPVSAIVPSSRATGLSANRSRGRERGRVEETTVHELHFDEGGREKEREFLELLQYVPPHTLFFLVFVDGRPRFIGVLILKRTRATTETLAVWFV